MAFEITDRYDGVTVWRDAGIRLYAATRDQEDGAATEPCQAIHETPGMAVCAMLEDETASLD